MKNLFMSISLICCSVLVGTPQEFIADLKASALSTVQTDPLLQFVDKNLLTQSITTLCDTGYLEVNNDPDHSTADLTLGIMEKTFANMINTKHLEIAIVSVLHPLPDLSVRFEPGYTENLSSLVLSPERQAALELRASAVESLLDTKQVGFNLCYSKKDYDDFVANPANADQNNNFKNFFTRHPQARADQSPEAPPVTLEGVVYKIRMNGMFYTFTANIPDVTSGESLSSKFYLLFPYRNDNASRAKQAEGAGLSNNIQYFFPR
jgi:hypothetical protein